MPQERIQFLQKKEVMTFEEMERLVRILASMGITKVRITGGEPFVRNDLMKLIRNIIEVPGIKDVHITTNGILTGPHIPELKRLGIASVNLSLDSLDKERFYKITRRDEFGKIMRTLNQLLEYEIPVKINAVVMEDQNIEDILPLVELTRHCNVEVRFIEEMPFNGKGEHSRTLTWTHSRILDHIRAHYPELTRETDPQFSTSYNYRVTGFRGSIGVIAAFSRTFCGTCNRIRVTPQGTLKTCLYDGGVLNLRDLMRSGDSDAMISEQLLKAFRSRAKDGFEAEKRNSRSLFESMSTIGG